MTNASLLAAVLCALIAAPAPAFAQGSGCAQPLATVTLAERTYANVGVREFEGRVFLYVPEIKSSSRGFDAFDLWVVEGVYGRPFVQPSGPMEKSAFDRLRGNTNVRATAHSIRTAAQSLRASIARQNFLLDVAVKAGGTDSVTARVCRAR